MKKILILILCITPIIVYAQTPEIGWQKIYGDGYTNNPSNIFQTSDGGFITAYNTGSITDQNEKIWVVKTDINGDLEWEKTYGGIGGYKGGIIRETVNGGFIILVQQTTYNGPASPSIKLIKIYQDGTIDWQKTYYDGYGYDIQQTDDFGFVIVGIRNITARPDVLILKLDQNGTLDWTKTYGGSQADWGLAIQQTTDNGYIIGGFTGSNDGDVTGPHYGGSRDFWILKLNNSGDLEWEKNYGGSGDEDVAFSILETSQGNYVVAGMTSSTDGNISHSLGGNDAWILQLDPLGGIIWEKTFGGSSNDYSREVKETKDGGFIIIGSTSSIEFSLSCKPVYEDMWIFKIKEDGELVWNMVLEETDGGKSISQTTDDGYIALGMKNSDLLIVKLGPEPDTRQWPRTYGSNICNSGSERTMNDIIVDNLGNVYTSGYIYPEDISFEENLFLSQGNKVLMKHDKKGKLIWINYLDHAFGGIMSFKEKGLKLVDDKLILMTDVPKTANVTSVSHSNMGIYVFDLEGNSLLSSPYEFGPTGYFESYPNWVGRSNRMRVYKDATGIHIIVAATFHGSNQNNIFDNGDYLITGPKTAILKFDLKTKFIGPKKLYIDYDTHSLIHHSNLNTHVDIYDIEFTKNNNKLFVTGKAMDGTATITSAGISQVPNQITNEYFGAVFTVSTQSLNLTQLNLFGTDRVGLLAYDDLYQQLYVERDGGIDLFQSDFLGSNQRIFNTNSLSPFHFYFHKPENALFVTYFYGSSFLAKINRFGTQWEIPLDSSIIPTAIAKGNNDFIFVSGSYYGDNNLDSFPIYQYNHQNSMDVFIGRIQDDNSNPVFYRSGMESISRKNIISNFISIYPNPGTEQVKVEIVEGDIINIELYPIDGKVILSKLNVYNKSSILDIHSLKKGIYFLKVESKDGIFTKKIIKN